ncbi:MAG: hypothetical protein WB800_28615 [Streptosporangiaceae bacterium]
MSALAATRTDFPAGFDLAPDDHDAYAGEPAYEICARTFVEFVWRFWIENEIWFALARKTQSQPLTFDQQHYVSHYEAS